MVKKKIKTKKVTNRTNKTNPKILFMLSGFLIVFAFLFPITSETLKKNDYSNKIKNFYTMMSTSIDKFENDYGLYTTRWNYNKSPVDFFYDYLSNTITYKNIEEFDEIPYITFEDGSLVFIEKRGCMDFVYDANGKHLPNIEGKDRYRFIICPSQIARQQRLKSFDVYNSLGEPFKSRTQILEKCEEDAAYCAALLRFDGWQYSKDYPYKL